jgi:carboxypeptidase D
LPFPSVKFVANQHGDEVVGRELVLRLATWLLENYDKDLRAQKIVDGVRLCTIDFLASNRIQRCLTECKFCFITVLMPSMNPDGFDLGTRENSGRVDLNRNFPDQYRSPADSQEGRQAETKVIMSWLASNTFVLSANMHGGEICVNYPFDAAPSRADEYWATPDDDIFRYISTTYANLNPDMKNHRCSNFLLFAIFLSLCQF